MIDADKVADIIRHVAETEVLPRFNNLQQSEIREKKPGDFVTIADEAAERVLSALLSDILPDSLVVGEEAVSKDSSVLLKLKDSKPVWVIDPIDGTYNFSHGSTKFGILVSLVQNGVTQFGWAFDAPGNRMVIAEQGAGAFLNGKRLSIACRTDELRDIILQGGGAGPRIFDPLRPLFKNIINLRCSLHDCMNFLTGEVDAVVHLNKVTPWDHSAPCLLMQEAGGYVALDREGIPYDPTRYGPAFLLAAANKEVWNKLHQVLYYPSQTS